MATFDFSGIKDWPHAKGTKILQQDKECLRLQISPAGRVFKVTGNGKGEWHLYIESPSTGVSFVSRSTDLKHLLTSIGFFPKAETNEAVSQIRDRYKLR